MLNGLLSLLHLTDPTLPIGGFSHSAGLETYVQLGLVRDLATAGEFLRSMLAENLRFTDAALMALAYRADTENDLPALLALDELATSVKLPAEIRMASQKLGIRLLKLFRDLYPSKIVRGYLEAVQNKTALGHYSLAFGVFAATMQTGLENALTGFYYNSAAGLVTNCVKLVPLGQQDGQQLLASLQTLIRDLVAVSLDPDPDLIGLCCSGFDIRSMQHEHLYSRLYMS